MSFVNAYDIKLKEGSLFHKSMETGLRYILSIDVDRLLAPCYEMHGLEAPNRAIRYKGWERKNANNWENSTDNYTLAGHSLGHFISAAAEFYNDHRNELVLNKLNYIISRLDELQVKSGSPYIGGCPEETFIKLFNGDEKWYEGYWVPWYNVHKIYQGLINAYRVTKDEKTLKVLVRFADWAVEGTSNLSEEEMQKMLEVEYGGMNEVFADIYELTLDKKYLECARRFNQDALIYPLSKKQDILSKLHANTQIPKIVGAAALYKQDNDRFLYCKDASMFFFDNVTSTRSYAIGGNSLGEHFETPEEEGLGKKTCESCNTYNMMRLAERIFEWDQSAKYMDYYERALYNHILGQQEPLTGAKQYFVSLMQGHHRVYEIKEESWWCCTGTGMENPGKYKKCVFYEKENKLYVNLYMPVEYKWENTGLTVQVDTDYPYDGSIKINILEGAADASFMLRVPGWLQNDIKVRVNDEPEVMAKAGTYFEVNRSFKQGDIIYIDMPLDMRIYNSRQQDKVVFMYGPFAMGGCLAPVEGNDKVVEYISNETIIDDETVQVPKLICEKAELVDIPRLVDKGTLTFVIDKEYTSDKKDITLKPFFSIHHQFHNVYWNI